MQGFFKLSDIKSSRPTTGMFPKCGACGLYRTCKSPKMQPWGKGRIKVLVVGEYPEPEDDQQGVPFRGPSGRFFRERAGRSGVDFHDLRITYAAICHPPSSKMPKDGKEFDWCRPNLARTVAEFKPRVIITLGRPGLASILAPYWRGSIDFLDKWVGSRIPVGGSWICPTWHPSFLMRERSEVRDRLFQDHLDAAFALADTPIPKAPEPDVELLLDEKRIIQAIRWFDEHGGTIAFDYETNCLKPEYPKARIWSCAISDGRRTVAFPWHGQAIKATSLLLRSSRTRKIAANMKFEQRWTLEHLGHPVNRFDWDTVLAAHCLDNRPHVGSLKFQAFVLMGVETYNDYHVAQYLETSDEDHYNRIHKVEMELLLKYNGMDAFLEKRLAVLQQRKFTSYESTTNSHP